MLGAEESGFASGMESLDKSRSYDTCNEGIMSATSHSLIAPCRKEHQRKRMKLEYKDPPTSDIANLRKLICEHKRKLQTELCEVFRDNLAELFYLQSGSNVIDIAAWKKKPNIALQNFLSMNYIDSDDEELDEISDSAETFSAVNLMQSSVQVANSDGEHSVEMKGSLVVSPSAKVSSPKLSPVQAVSSADVLEGTGCTTEAIVEQAKKEAQVMQRIAELRKLGLWSAKRMPKVQEPARNKAHRDYLLEEMQWLATDFAQERKWKRAGCRKISRLVLKYFQDKAEDEKKAEKDEVIRLRKVAGQLGKMVKDFWSNIEKVVQYKQQSRLDEKRRQALDLHLNFIVDQTEKYSSWLSAGLSTGTADHDARLKGSTPELSPASSPVVEDEEFQPDSGSTDDEETIAKEENSNQGDASAEIAALQAESEMSMEQLLASLPSEILEKPASLKSSADSSYASVPADEAHDTSSDEEFVASDAGDVIDDEQTLTEQENQEREEDYNAELAELHRENEMSIEELAAKYAGAYDSDFEIPNTPSSVEQSEEAATNDQLTPDESEAEADDIDQEEMDEYEPEQEVGMEYLLHPEKDEADILSDHEGKGPGRDITDIAAAAQSLQPTGYTLETTVVKTPIPFLLKHGLREYQHVGLDWLATMYEKKLNGILADEMGLGKTIQTIALLAHLACEHGIWGPHLIVVPTSVMLNWEMELKKWCPGFKILTYYGSSKERKIKRTGWTKPNAFHVCITSYKIVIQDHIAFKRKKWKYLILDEAQNIKNFKSQRWQTLLNFQSQRRLLLTGTPLQNNLMELWSLMHFLMPNVFQSHAEFKEWFANPLTGMIEGGNEYNESLIRRLHKVLRPFLLRRLKRDVEKQLPKKYEHVVMCKLSKRQRFLYDEYMSRRQTRETLAGGHFMSVINILMQLRKVCNHPDMFEPRPIVSPMEMEGISVETAAVVLRALDYRPLSEITVESLHPNLADLELSVDAYAAYRYRRTQTPRRLIEAIDDEPEPAPRPPPTKLRPMIFRSDHLTDSSASTSSTLAGMIHPSHAVSITSSLMKPASPAAAKPHVRTATGASTPTTTSALQTTTGFTSLVSGAAKLLQSPAGVATTAALTSGGQPITVQIQQTPTGTRLMIPNTQLSQFTGLLQIIQTSSGQQLITSVPTSQQATGSAPTSSFSNSTVSSAQVSTTQFITTTALTSALSKAMTLSSVQTAAGGSISGAGRSTASVQLPSGAMMDPATGKPVIRVTPVTSVKTIIAPASNSSTTAPRSGSLIISTSVGSTVAEAFSQSSAIPTVTAPASGAPTATKSVLGPASRKRALENEARQKLSQELKLDSVIQKALSWRKSTLDRVATQNRLRCCWRPVYGQDLHNAVDVWSKGACDAPYVRSFSTNGVVYCHNTHALECCNLPRHYWQSTTYLKNMILLPEQRIDQLLNTIERFVFVTPSVRGKGIFLHTPYNSDLLRINRSLELSFRPYVSRMSGVLHPVKTRMLVQFPEKRLIQYDCGKLQTLDILLRELRQGNHRVLIFTQMTRMLDVLEVFLNFHGHRYLRLDGSTRIEMRQALMDRFNADKRIFCFILSTRSGGIGVNLTGADTVIFYDSDWNPTMDAQAQDRCHRIGQTRDVHIYRLISEKTVEENILKKANQKRLLGDVAIEGGNFTTAKLKDSTITDLFAEPSGLESLVKEKQALEWQMADAAPLPSQREFEQALCQAEDEDDVKAAAVMTEEVSAELAEFDEDIPWDERESEQQRQLGDKPSKVELEISMMEKELTAVERYAIHFLEQTDDQFSEDVVKIAEEDIQMAKREWELSRLKQAREEEERAAAIEEDVMLYTYNADSMQVFQDWAIGENMPMWSPPTPPHHDNDVFVDNTLCFLYDSAVMTESQLPPVYIKKEKRQRPDSTQAVVKKKIKQEVETTGTAAGRVPRSLFDRPSAALLKLRREKAMLRQGSALAGSPSYQALLGMPQQKPPAAEPAQQDQPEWLIHEDWALLQAVQTLLQLPLNLTILSPAHIPNWDLVSDVVSTTSRIYRSSKQCKLRYENVIIPREEGKITYDPSPARKQAKAAKTLNKGIYKTKNSKPMRTGQLFSQDSGSSVTTLHAFRFDCIKSLASKRTPTLRPTLVNPTTTKNPKHAAVLQDNGINYDQPMNPEEVAKIRQERIKNEKKADQNLVAATQRTAQMGTAAVVSRSGTPGAMGVTGVIAAVAVTQSVQLQQTIVSASASAIMSSATKSALTSSTVGGRTLPTGSIVVSTPNTTFSLKRGPTGSPLVNAAQQPQIQQVTTTLGTATQRRVTPQELQQMQARGALAGSAVLTQYMRQIPATSTIASGAVPTSRTITVQQTPIVQGKSLTQQSQLTQLNMIKQTQLQQQRAVSPGSTLVAQRATIGTLRPTAVHKTLGVTTMSTTGPTTAVQGKAFQARVSESDMLILKQKQLQQQLQQRPQLLTGQLQQTVVTSGQLPNQKMVAALHGQQALVTSGQQVQQTVLGPGQPVQQTTVSSALHMQQTVVSGSSQVQHVTGLQTGVPTLVKTVTTGVTNTSVAIPVTNAVNINVTIPQQQKTVALAGTVVSQQATQQQFRQILLHKPARPIQQQKIGLTQQHLVPSVKAPGSVQIVQQKPGASQANMQQIQQLIKQTQAARSENSPSQQHIQQIITAVTQSPSITVGAATHTAAAPTTIIGSTQLISSQSTGMAAVQSGNVLASSSAKQITSQGVVVASVSNVQIPMRPLVSTSSSPVTIGPLTSAGPSLVAGASSVKQNPVPSITVQQLGSSHTVLSQQLAQPTATSIMNKVSSQVVLTQIGTTTTSTSTVAPCNTHAIVTLASSVPPMNEVVSSASSTSQSAGGAELEQTQDTTRTYAMRPRKAP